MIVIIGAGISGLTCANNLNKKFIILEKSDKIGGLSTQYYDNGFLFDFGGHYFHFKNKENIRDYVFNFERFLKFYRKSKVFVNDKFISFPIQYHLSEFSKDIGFKIYKEMINRKDLNNHKNFEDFILNNFGKTLYEIFFKPFLSKYYKEDLKQMKGFDYNGSIPIPNKREIQKGYRGENFNNKGYNSELYYPENGLKDFIFKYSSKIKENILLNQEVKKIDIKEKIVYTENKKYEYSELISTMPLKELLKIIENSDFQFDYNNLKHISTLIVNCVLKHKRKEFDWVYLPQKEFDFYRAGYYKYLNYNACYLEKTISKNELFSTDTLIDNIYFTLNKLGFIENKNEIEHISFKTIPISYIIFNSYRENHINLIYKSLEKHNIYLTGRYAKWTYSSMSEDILNSLILTKKILD